MKIAVLGATGAVGRNLIRELEHSIPLKNIELSLFASEKSKGKKISFREQALEVQAFHLEKVRKTDFVLMSAGSSFSQKYTAQIVEDNGPTVIDNSPAWRMHEDVPLVIPEVNAHSLKGLSRGSIVANPNCAMIQLAVSLQSLKERFGIKFVQVTTLQSVSGTGFKGIEALSKGLVQDHLDPTEAEKVYEHPIAFNTIPYIGEISESGYSEEELKITEELKKVLEKPNLSVMATTIRVPVFYCHGESVTVELSNTANMKDIESAFSNSKNLKFYPNSETPSSMLPTPRSMKGIREVVVARPRFLDAKQHGTWLQFWNLADNLKKGAATNAVQILECLL